MNEISAICPSCKASFSAEPKQTFLGFQRMTCPSCSADVTYPLTRGYRIAYWIIASLMLVTIAYSFTEGEIGFPGGLGIAVLIALVIDWRLQRKVAATLAKGLAGPV